MRSKILVLWSVLMMVGTICFADEIESRAIFKKVIAKYESLETYGAAGMIVSDIDNGSTKMKVETSFSMKLKKPNLYLISWHQKGLMGPGSTQSGAVWNAGPQPYLYMSAVGAYSKMSSDGAALASATGVSAGAAFTIPSLFLSVSAIKEQPAPFSRLVDVKLEKSEQVGGDDCYVISGSSAISKRETFWISKKSYVIRKYARSLEPPEGGMKMPQVTDQQLEESIKAMGLEVTEERKESMRKMMKQLEETMRTASLRGISTELYVKIDTPKLMEGDFVFKLPDGTALKESLFDGMLNAE